MNTQPQVYDVVIMGAGFAGVCQARHLMLNIPNIKVALIDPRPEERSDKDMKIGESMIEAAALTVCKDLGLYEYMIENHTPKNGLSFHWPKDPTHTESTDDYFHIWINRQAPIPSFHMNRAKFERDLLKMNKEMGADFYNGSVVDVDLTAGDTLHTIKVKLKEETIELQANHLIDAAGRKFIIGRKTDNVVFHQAEAGEGPENLYNLRNGSAWVRVRNVDRTIFDQGYNPDAATTSRYYCTNHWFGHGHWLWMIPSDKQPLELSLGVMHHHEVISGQSLNSLDKFYAFLKANHTVLYDLVMSGEVVDFHYWPRPAHTSKQLYSKDNWYVIGDAACIFDAFYSYGTTMISLSLLSITEIIRAKLAGEPDAEEKRDAYNQFNLAYITDVNRLYRYHAKQLGHASVMSWRIYFEYMWWFGIHVPLFLGKWFLDVSYVRRYLHHSKKIDSFVEYVHKQFSRLVDKDANLGLLDCYRSDQLIGNYSTLKHFDSFLENAKYEPRRTNIFGSTKSTYFYVAIWFLMLQWKGFGIAGLLDPKTYRYFFQLIFSSLYAGIGEQIYLRKTRHLPANSQIAAKHEAFKNYQYNPQLQPWKEEAIDQDSELVVGNR